MQSSHHKCQVCQTESKQELVHTDVAHCSSETSNLVMVSKLACQGCRGEISTIRHFVQENGLGFGKNSSMYRELIQIHIPQQPHPHPTLCLHSDLYNKSVQLEIKRNKLYHCAKLPQNCLQLVYYSSFNVNHAQRHERIRNTIGECMKVAPIPFANLEDIAILVHCLCCFMHENQVIMLVGHICRKSILEGLPIEGQVEGDLPMEKLWKELYSGFYIGNILVVMSSLLTNWRNFSTNLGILQSYQGYIKKQKLKELLSQPGSPTLKKNLSLQLQSSQITEAHSSCKQCNRYRSQELLNEARFKNMLTLVLNTLIKEDALHRDHVLQMEAKFLREKQEFINKIIKLKDKIQVLERSEESDGLLRRARSVSDCHIKTMYRPDLESVSEKSEGTSKTIEVKEENAKVNEPQKTRDNEIQKAKQSESVGYLQRLLTQLPQFEPSLLESNVEQKVLTDIIQKSVKNMRQELEKLEKKNRLLENQSKRLLSILTRKQERFVPLIHEKDEIIQKYQNALWRMEHGLIVEDPALAPRIASIINVFKNEFMESLSNGTLESDRFIEEPVKQEVTPSKTSKKKKEKEKTKVSSSEQKAKAAQKQCAIF